MFISFDFSPRGSLQYEIIIAMECIKCRCYFVPSTCDACWMDYCSRVAWDFREDGSRPRLSLAILMRLACGWTCAPAPGHDGWRCYLRSRNNV